MRYISPAALVFNNDEEEYWIEYSTGCNAINTSKNLAKFITDNCGQAIRLDLLKNKVAMDKTLSEADASVLLTNVCVQALGDLNRATTLQHKIIRFLICLKVARRRWRML